MDVFMRNISFQVTQDVLKIRLAEILHGPDYSHHSTPTTLINFDVRLHRKPARNGTFTGIFTLPREEIASQFLREYQEPQPLKSLTIGSTRIVFQRSNRPTKPDVVETIRRFPYLDPRVVQEREDATTQLQAQTVAITTVQFGWVCRDEVFSVEWEQERTVGSDLSYVADKREFRVKIYWLGAAVDRSDIPSIFFHLNEPPAFESEHILWSASLNDLISALSLDGRSRATSSRQRWSAFNASHEDLAPYTSIAIRLVCKSTSDLGTFRSFCAHANAIPHRSPFFIEYRRLFSLSIRYAFADWLSRLDWSIAFQLEALARSYLMDLGEILGLRPKVETMVANLGNPMTCAFLRDFGSRAKEAFRYGDGDGQLTSQDVVGDLFNRTLRDFLLSPSLLGALSDDNNPDLFHCLHVIVTPTTMYLEGPYPERSNRVMRTYKENQDSFLRVSFVDESRLAYRFDPEVNVHDLINRRVKALLLDGLYIAGRKFEFLAYSQSALKEHAVWFVKEFTHTDGRIINAANIIASLGSFSNLAYDRQLIYCPARYAARISQAFTATDSSITVNVEEVFEECDIKDHTDTYCFTDGVGTISAELAKAIMGELRAKRRRARRNKTYPRLYQIRFMGSKGMVSVDYKLQGRLIVVRPSMIKFDAPNSLEIEIARAFERPGEYYLNRPLIMLLEGLGVPYEFFQKLQDDAVRDARDSLSTFERSSRLLDTHGLGGSYRLSSTLLSLHRLGLAPLSDDKFWRQMMDFAVNHILRELKHHARIPLPRTQAWTLVGVADVHGYLEENEIFACVDYQDGTEPVFLEGRVVISRSPTIHPGDVQIARAIGRPPPGSPFEHETLSNGVVFSIKGERPLPSCLGGGDLDGDLYNVTTMRTMLPRRTYRAANYEPGKRKLVDHPSTMADVADFVAEYISSDTLGIIATNWLIIADQSTENILDPDCLKLSMLHSIAVDYPKTGLPVPLGEIPKLKFRAKPDWNAPETLNVDITTSGQYYESSRAIGKLFRAINLPALSIAARTSRLELRRMREGQEIGIENVIREFHSYEPHQSSRVQLSVEHRISEFIPLPDEDEVDDNTIQQIWELLCFYTSRLRAICADHTLSHSRSAMLTEAEAVVGTIVAKSSQPRKRKDMMSKMREQTATLIAGVRAEISGDDDTPAEASLERAWIAYKLALIEEDTFGARSFAWIALGEIFDAIKDIEMEDRRLLR